MLLSGLVNSGYYKEALEIYNKIKNNEKHPLDTPILLPMINLAIQSGDIKLTKSLWVDFVKHNVTRSPTILSQFLLARTASNDLKGCLLSK